MGGCVTSAAEYLLDKIETVSPLDRAARDAVLALPVTVRKFRRRAAIVREGEYPSQSFAVLEGVTAMVKSACKENRRRQGGR